MGNKFTAPMLYSFPESGNIPQEHSVEVVNENTLLVDGKYLIEVGQKIDEDDASSNNGAEGYNEPAFDPHAHKPMVKVSQSANTEELPYDLLREILASYFPEHVEQEVPTEQTPQSSEAKQRYAFFNCPFKVNPNPVDNPLKEHKILPDEAGKLINGIESENWEPGVKFLTLKGQEIPLPEIRTIYTNVLSGQVIAAYMEMIVHQSQTNQELPNVHVVDHALGRSIVMNGADKTKETFGSHDVIDKELIFFPFFWRGYWSLTVFDFKNCTVDHFDIFKGSITQPITKQILLFVAYNHSQMKVRDWDHWITRHRQDFPIYEKQDSGILILQVAEWFSRRQGLEKPDFDHIRKKLVLELYQQRFHLDN